MIPEYEKNEYVKIKGKKYKVIHPHMRNRKHKARHGIYNFINLNPAKTNL